MATVIDGCIYSYFPDVATYCYNSSQDVWTILPPLPVKWIGLGQIDKKLVTVGGLTREMPTKLANKLYTYDKAWNQTFHQCQQLDVPQVY